MIGEGFEGAESDCDLGDCTVQESWKPPVKSPKPVVFGGFFHAVHDARIFGWNLEIKKSEAKINKQEFFFSHVFQGCKTILLSLSRFSKLQESVSIFDCVKYNSIA